MDFEFITYSYPNQTPSYNGCRCFILLNDGTMIGEAFYCEYNGSFDSGITYNADDVWKFMEY